MKYGLVSDLHINHYAPHQRKIILDKINSSPVDHILIAGDFCDGPLFRDEILRRLTKPYTYVLGNHDYYGGQVSDFRGTENNITYATLWTNFGDNRLSAVVAKNSVRDFFAIQIDNGELIRPSDMVGLFHLHKEFIEDNPADIVMTHFAPHHGSIAEKYMGDPCNPYFVNNIDDEFIQKVAKVWVHGHIHTPCDYMVGATRIIANPLGYPDENYHHVSDYPIVEFEL